MGWRDWLYRNWAFATAAMLPAAFTLLLLVPGSWRSGAAWLAWAHPAVYFMHQIEEHAWPGGFKRFINQRVFKILDRDLPLDDRAVFWINVPLTWVFYPLAALLLDTAPALAAGCFALSIINGCVHSATALRFGEWNPGLVTGVTLLIPVGWAGYASMHDRLSGAEAATAWAIGIGVHVAIVLYALAILRASRRTPDVQHAAARGS